MAELDYTGRIGTQNLNEFQEFFNGILRILLKAKLHFDQSILIVSWEILMGHNRPGCGGNGTCQIQTSAVLGRDQILPSNIFYRLWYEIQNVCIRLNKNY